ncbi:hypothetical protein [Sphaerisporangium perillae]|uniref:hypothetical protein n=1 Tax=Sphaerisporangium perillae TaxID=2935860 RepID=UPI00201048B4|nr:hypothetical protein [Sphaerisporangium perillae]
MTESGEDLLRKALTGGIAELTGSKRLIVFEIAAEGITAFDVRRDETGTPRGRVGPVMPWKDSVTSSAERAVAMTSALSGEAMVILVCPSPDSPPVDQAMESLRAARPGVLTFAESGVRVAELLRQVIADEPLWQSYDLVVLQRHPVTGGIRFAGHPMFRIEARRGELAEFAVDCEPGDEHGTMFAVAAWQGPRPRLLSVHAASLPPGRHRIVAELERPGRVLFHEPPGLVRCDRTWDELVASVPPRLDRPADPAHLICAVEVGGPRSQVAERLSRVGQLVTAMADDLFIGLRVSLIAYGTHSFERRIPDEPVHVACWQVSPEQAQDSLRRLEERHDLRMPAGGATARGYAYAAQVEDMLAEVTRRLDSGSHVRTVLLTVGDRPPHPPRAHPSEILPCPHRIDWEQHVLRLERHPALVFGAICDQPPERAHPIWSRLGREALAHLDAVDVHGLSADLGLTPPQVQRFPLPFLAVP